jgi:hypothetical protein
MVFLLMRTADSEDKLAWLQTVFNDGSLDIIFGLLEQATFETDKLSHWFSQIFARVLPANPDRATSILITMMQSESYETSRTAMDLFASVAAVRPQQLMDGIGEVMLSKERNFSFLFCKFPIVALPEEVVIRWPLLTIQQTAPARSSLSRLASMGTVACWAIILGAPSLRQFWCSGFQSHRRVLNRYDNSLSLKSIGKSIRQVKANPSNQQL